MLSSPRGQVLGKIAADLQQALGRRAVHGLPGGAIGTRLAAGDGWSASDVICTSGPADRSFEEQHARVSIAVVVAGSFQYRSPHGRGLMTPGSFLVGNDGECFECGHEHAAGDRCVSFHFAPALFERIAADAGATPGARRFTASRLPPIRALSRLATQAAAGAALAVDVSWEELAFEIAATAVQVAAGTPAPRDSPSSATVARVTESVRRIENEPGTRWTLARLATDARQSPFHYLRTFRQLTGVTPHQFILRARLRQAGLMLLADDAKVIDIALATGFGDLSNFNDAFKAEFGVPPRSFRARRGQR